MQGAVWTVGRRRTAVRLAALFVMVAAGVTTAAAPVAAGAGSGFATPSELSASLEGGGSFWGVSCPDATDCTAVGSDANNQPIYATERGGSWGPVVELPDVPGAGGLFSSVSCVDAFDCTAAGNDGNNQPMYATERGGVWSAAIEVPGSPGGSGQFNAISCAGVADATNCTAVGSDGGDLPIYATGTGGFLGGVVELHGSVGDGAEFWGVSCTGASDCTAVGTSGVRSGTSKVLQPVYATETQGLWGAVASVSSTSGSDDQFWGVSCTDAVNCTAVGYDVASTPIYATETAGTWGTATDIPSAPGTGGNYFQGVSCTDAADCTAVGLDDNNQPIYANETAGTWGPVGVVTGSPGGGGNFYGVSCADAADCTAVGSDGNNQPIFSNESGSTAPAITSAGSATFRVGSAGTFTVTATGSPAPSFTETGPLPPGVSLNATTGVLSGTPASTAGGTYPITITAANGTVPDASQHFTLTVDQAVSGFSLAPLSTLSATSAPVTYHVSLSGAGPVPTGSVSVSDDRGGSCTIATLVAGAGSCALDQSAPSGPYAVTASYSGGGTYLGATTSIAVTGAVSTGGTAVTGDDQVTATATGGTDGVDTVSEAQYGSDPVGSLTDGTDYFDVAVSPGSTFSTVAIEDCNSPTASTLLTWWDPSAKGGDGAWEPVVGDPGPTYVPGPPACVTATLTTTTSPSISQLHGTVFGAAAITHLTITTTSLPAGVRGHPYSAVLAAFSGNPPYTWKVVAGKLPKGLKLNKGTGVISGTPKKSSASSTFTIEVLDAKTRTKPHTQHTATASVTLVIS